ncbi:MAG: SCP-like extracellular protein [Verrucomicrobiales bacterium]|nr:SCP-like extracellular protein [Verrucomicrobiales bacterium]
MSKRYSLLGPLLVLAGSVFSPMATAAPSSWQPVDGVVPAGDFVVDTSSRMESLSFYNTVFLASEGAESRINWTGAFGSCSQGNTDINFRRDIRRRVNYYRAICGLPTVTFDAEGALNDGPAGSPQIVLGTSKRACAQGAAYMNAFSRVFYPNSPVTHDPAATSNICWTTHAWNGCYHSNLTVGYFGPKAIDVYMADDNANGDASADLHVGHRRWILFSRARDMSSGDVPQGTYVSGLTSYPVQAANALYVTGFANPVETSPRKFVTWPPQGYVPAPIKPIRWSVSFPDAVFPTTAAAITLKGPNGAVIPVTVLSANYANLGDPSLVFQPSSTPLAGTADTTYTVTVTGISGPNVPSSITWQTTFFNPDILGVDQTITGPAKPAPSGADYQFTPIPIASAYQLTASQPAAKAHWIEAADGLSPQILPALTGNYSLIQGAGILGGLLFGPGTGLYSFHLSFPFEVTEPDSLPHDQSFSLGSEFIPDPASTLRFYEYFRWLFSVNRLSAELSADGGVSWTEIYGRNGNSVYSVGGKYFSSSWDQQWFLRTISLAPWAGKPVRLRFILRHGGVPFEGPDLNHGCYIDEITLSNVNKVIPGNAITSFFPNLRFDSQLVGAPPVPGSPYLLRVRSQIGTKLMGFSSPLTVTPRPPTGFESNFPALAAAPLADSDHDGVSNLVEYAFGMDPSKPVASQGLPQAATIPGALSIAFTVPPYISDMEYGAECTTDMKNWQPVTNQGNASQRTYNIPVVPGQKCFMRLKVNQVIPP